MRLTINDLSLEGHAGFGGSFMYLETVSGTFIHGTVNQANTNADVAFGALEVVLAR